ncbi:uncharacterized protein DFL_000643 [Arthrobotrys flagrans]|uniref:Uncharacterized protein n=1 Tax=Arthrobotrys flagrans TaxID=97331 RepID=A0A437AEB9_ARTFL|nr:hypothetical protein DFL_000643 [Arthrobotrys flagrans]
MYLPPEILLSIVDNFDCTPDSPTSDRATLIALRSASKDFYSVVTLVLFRDLSLHYGVSRSVPQMQGITSSSVIRPHIRSLFIPSESFFPLGKDVQFNTTKPYLFAKKEFREQEQGYRAALSDFIEACENLEEVHIAVGLGGDTERMSVFGKILGKHLMPRIVAKGIRRLVVSAPSAHSISLPFTGYVGSSKERFGNLPDFSSLESFTLQSCYGSGAEPASKDFVDLLDTLTGLNSFTLSMSSPLKRQSTRGLSRYPISATCHNLTSVKLSSLFLGQNEDYLQDFLSAVPTIQDLVLNQIALPISNRMPESHSLVAKTWRALFQHISTVLLKLKAYKFQHLMYGAIPEPMWWGRNNTDVHLLLPVMIDNEELTPHTWDTKLRGAELVSPFHEDLKGLQSLRKMIRDRRTEQDLDSDAYREDIPLPMWAEGREKWMYIVDD